MTLSRPIRRIAQTTTVALTVALTLGNLGGLQADEAQTIPRVDSAEEFENLPEEVQKAYPAFDAFKLFDSLPAEAMVMMTEIALLELKYYLEVPTAKENDKLKAAIRDFQKDIGENPTGILTMGQWETLTDRHSDLTYDMVRPMSVTPSVSISGEVADAEGTWSFEGNAVPIQMSKIQCFYSTGHCFEAMASANYEPVEIFGDSTPQLEAQLVLWTIDKWTPTEVQASYSASCASYTLTIDIDMDSAIQVRRGKGCPGIADEPQILKLVSGFDAWREYRDKLNEEKGELTSQKFRDQAMRNMEVLRQRLEEADGP
jgi:hypothetical protein